MNPHYVIFNNVLLFLNDLGMYNVAFYVMFHLLVFAIVRKKLKCFTDLTTVVLIKLIITVKIHNISYM